MGGSGGGGYFHGSGKPPEDLSKKIREEESQAVDVAFEAEVANLLKGLLASANSRDNDQLKTHLGTIKAALDLGIDGTIDLRYGGSVSKHTYVDGLSDIDTLAILNNTELSGLSPNEVKQYFFDRLQTRLPNTEISMGALAITVKFASGFEVQILPTIKVGDGIKIPSSVNKNEWSNIIQPKSFVESLRYVNIHTSGKLVPMIKLAKSIIAGLPEQRQLSGYHVESLAIEVFANYTGEHNSRAMLKHFFAEGSKKVLTPIKDKTGQSTHVDQYMGETNSLKRKMSSDSFSTIARKMQNADGSKDVRVWNDILN